MSCLCVFSFVRARACAELCSYWYELLRIAMDSSETCIQLEKQLDYAQRCITFLELIEPVPLTMYKAECTYATALSMSPAHMFDHASSTCSHLEKRVRCLALNLNYTLHVTMH